MTDDREYWKKQAAHWESQFYLAIKGAGELTVDLEQTRAALRRIADKDAWAAKYPFGNYECIAVEAIGIARDALRTADHSFAERSESNG